MYGILTGSKKPAVVGGREVERANRMDAHFGNNAPVAINPIEALETEKPVGHTFDDKIVEMLNDKNRYVTVPSLITMNKIALANFNDRYLSLLPLVYQSLSILLDVDAVSISDGEISEKNIHLFDDMVEKCDSQSLDNICKASERLFGMIDRKQLSGLYKTLKIEL